MLKRKKIVSDVLSRKERQPGTIYKYIIIKRKDIGEESYIQQDMKVLNNWQNGRKGFYLAS